MYTNKYIYIYICIHTNLSLRLLVAHYNTLFLKIQLSKSAQRLIPSMKLTYPPPRHFWRSFSFFLKVGYVSFLGYCIPFLCYLIRNPNIHDRRCAPLVPSEAAGHRHQHPTPSTALWNETRTKHLKHPQIHVVVSVFWQFGLVGLCKVTCKDGGCRFFFLISLIQGEKVSFRNSLGPQLFAGFQRRQRCLMGTLAWPSPNLRVSCLLKKARRLRYTSSAKPLQTW